MPIHMSAHMSIHMCLPCMDPLNHRGLYPSMVRYIGHRGLAPNTAAYAMAIADENRRRQRRKPYVRHVNIVGSQPTNNVGIVNNENAGTRWSGSTERFPTGRGTWPTHVYTHVYADAYADMSMHMFMHMSIRI